MQNPKTITIRIDAHALAVVDAWRKRFDEERPGVKASTSDVIRSLLARVGMPPGRRKTA